MDYLRLLAIHATASIYVTIHDLFDSVISMQALFPLQVFFVDELKAALYPVPQKQRVDYRNFSYSRCHQAQGNVI
jgi:hypothetical protein